MKPTTHNHLGRRLVSWIASTWLLVPALGAVSTPDRTVDGFAVPQPGTVFTFPRDHGSHPEYRIEWWYLTGHLQATNTPSPGNPATSRHFGFQATFFRRSAPRTAGPSTTSAAFGTDNLYLAHMALLDAQSGRFLHEERLNREGWDATSNTRSLDLRNGNWSLRLATPSGIPAPTRMELVGGIRAEAQFQLVLEPTKPLVVFGTNGVSRKAPEPSASSHYLTFPRLATRGTLRMGGTTFTVTGSSWMDHEISSSQLGEGQVGWDWACLQLNDGREIMAYRMRRHDGTTDPFSTLAWVDTEGGVRHLGADAFRFEPLTTWRSPRSQATYPAKVRLTTTDPSTGRPRSFVLEPLAADQELSGGGGGIPYWEGACRVRDDSGAEVGQAFLEMTGYAGELRRTLE